jgi:hypothetical protein
LSGALRSELGSGWSGGVGLESRSQRQPPPLAKPTHKTRIEAIMTCSFKKCAHTRRSDEMSLPSIVYARIYVQATPADIFERQLKTAGNGLL